MTMSPKLSRKAARRLLHCNIPVVYTKISTENHYKMRQWLIDNIDPECYDAEDFSPVDEDHSKRRIWFANSKDAVWFDLVWG